PARGVPIRRGDSIAIVGMPLPGGSRRALADIAMSGAGADPAAASPPWRGSNAAIDTTATATAPIASSACARRPYRHAASAGTAVGGDGSAIVALRRKVGA